ncbi:hypothetical protein ACIBO5_45365 [Nonomuraea angiospora]|uniref:hypothetical protein n=1 Tax=Nonomuraea angiospora TaxID=46172 RepID=UPI0037B975F5
MVTRSFRSIIRVAASVAVAVLCGGGCGAAARPDAEREAPAVCDDTIRAAKEVPRELLDDGIERAVGESDIWFIAPDDATWGASVEPAGNGFYAKRPLWTSSDKPPSVTVTAVGTSAKGEATLSPTSEGLPGPLPMGVRFPSRGCWKITAASEKGRAEIIVKI